MLSPLRGFIILWSSVLTIHVLRPLHTFDDMSHSDALIPYAVRQFARDGGLHPTSEVVLNWPKPNYINPEDRGWRSSIALLVVLGTTFMVYIARMWARLCVAKNAGLDDIIMSVAIIPLFGLTVSTVLGGSVIQIDHVRS